MGLRYSVENMLCETDVLFLTIQLRQYEDIESHFENVLQEKNALDAVMQIKGNEVQELEEKVFDLNMHDLYRYI